jgi:hypothetical protein
VDGSSLYPKVGGVVGGSDRCSDLIDLGGGAPQIEIVEIRAKSSV